MTSATKKMTSPRRKSIPPVERLKAWVRAGGRCTLCGNYLMEGSLTGQELTLGELAHIVGATTGEKSPRGSVGEMSEAERNSANNLMLVCAGEHDEIDRAGVLEIATVERLQELKRAHEERIRRLTGLEQERATVVLRMVGKVRDTAVELTRATAGSTVFSDLRFPSFPLSYDQQGLEIDLRDLPLEGSDAYWSMAKAKIDDVVDKRLSEGVAKGEVSHVSVFAFARLPLLVYLGSRLDDGYGVEIYQRHRATEAWEWDANAMPVQFAVVQESAGRVDDEVVLVVNASGTIKAEELPEALRNLERHVLAPQQETPSVDTFRARETLANFEASLRQFLSRLEATNKSAGAIHVFAAAPVAAAVAIGRVRDPHVHPPFKIYDKSDGNYSLALEV